MRNTAKLYDIFHIVNGEHGDPHIILGMHEVEKDGKKVKQSVRGKNVKNMYERAVLKGYTGTFEDFQTLKISDKEL